MAIGGKITRFNMYQLSPYDRIQHQRSRRAEAAAMGAKQAAFAGSFASIQRNNATELGNLISKVAMQRIFKKV
ncbi:hypothetical protein [Devosia sp. XK-2]|uniref:hypothetical protein n=1 Tax=Devosia sp. XK-2 TaxID=3126689 RepID=UPI0030CCE48D